MTQDTKRRWTVELSLDDVLNTGSIDAFNDLVEAKLHECGELSRGILEDIDYRPLRVLQDGSIEIEVQAFLADGEEDAVPCTFCETEDATLDVTLTVDGNARTFDACDGCGERLVRAMAPDATEIDVEFLNGAVLRARRVPPI